MNSTAENTTTERRHTRPVLCAFLGLIIIAVAITVGPRLVSAVEEYNAAKTHQAQAANGLTKAADDKIAAIKEMGLSEYAGRTSTSASPRDSAEARHSTSGDS